MSDVENNESSQKFNTNGQGFSLLFRWQLLHAIMKDTGLTISARAVAGRLLDHMNCKHRQCFPSGQLLADTLGISRDTVVRCVAELRDLEWFQTEKVGRKLVYTIHPKRLTPDAICRKNPCGPVSEADTNQGIPNQEEYSHSSASLQNESPPIEEKDLSAEKAEACPRTQPIDWDDRIFRIVMPEMAKLAGCSQSLARSRIAGLIRNAKGMRSEVYEALRMTIEAQPSGNPFDYAQGILTSHNGTSAVQARIRWTREQLLTPKAESITGCAVTREMQEAVGIDPDTIEARIARLPVAGWTP